MPIVSSSYIIDSHTQASGSRYVRETLTDNTGRIYNNHYELPAGQGDTEAAAFLAQRAAGLNTQLAESEAETLIGD